MKIKYLGTGAAEGVPAFFCHCDVCNYAREHGGREVRSRCQAIVDDELILDCGPDTFMHMIQYDMNLTEMEHCLITHVHEDHLVPETFLYRQRGFANLKEDTKPLNVYGSKDVGNALKAKEDGTVTADGSVVFHEMVPFHEMSIGSFKVTAFPAVHGTENPYFYMIRRNDRTMLYAHDTDVFSEQVWEYFEKEKIYFDLVSLDCTEGTKRNLNYRGHMNFERNEEVRERMLQMGIADTKTKFVSNHFSHNGQATYAAACQYGEEHGFVVAYDGMEMEV